MIEDDIAGLPDDVDAAATEYAIRVTMKRAARIAIASHDLLSYFKGLLNESDRAVGILAFAFIESQITDLFRQHLHPAVHGGADAILGTQGILDSIGSQIKMLQALGWLTDEAFHDLRLMARIRNRFAHAHVALTFDDVKVRGYFDSLSKGKGWSSKNYPEVVLTIREKFLVRAALTLFRTYVDLCLLPVNAFPGAGFDRYPEQLQGALVACMSAAEAVYEHAAARSNKDAS